MNLPASSIPVTMQKPISAKMTALPIWGSIIDACSATAVSKAVWAPACSNYATAGNCEQTIAGVLLQGHTFTNEPIMKPARTMSVSLCHLAKSQCRNLEKARIPIHAPTRKMPMIIRFFPKSTPATSSEMVLIMNSYFPKISRMKLPEMPGRIIAQIAIDPLRKINQRASGVCVGERVQMTTPRIQPNTKRSPSRSFQPEIPRRMKIDEATMRPKKNAHV